MKTTPKFTEKVINIEQKHLSIEEWSKIHKAKEDAKFEEELKRQKRLGFAYNWR